MSNRRYRVAVQFTDYSNLDEETDRQLMTKIFKFTTPMRGSQSSLFHMSPAKHIEVEVLSMNSLQMVNRDKPSHAKVVSMRYDCVGSCSDPHIRLEVANLVDYMFVQSRNCFLLHFSEAQDCQLSFLCNLLVTEMDKCIQMLHCKIVGITLEYYELRKHSVVNMLESVATKTSRSKKASTPPTLFFQNTLELLQWLQSKYVQLWRKCLGNESLDFRIHYSDMNRQPHTVRLSLMMVNMQRMDCETKNKLGLYLKNLNGGKKLKRTLLGDFLNDYFHRDEKWRTLIFFDIPVRYGCGYVIEEMLDLATKAYDGVTSMENNQEDNVSININSDVLLDLPAVPEATAMDNAICINQPPRLKSGFSSFLRSSGMSSQRQWHRRIDDSFNNVVDHLEAFYDRKYQHKIASLSTDIRSMTGSTAADDGTTANLDPTVAHIMNGSSASDDLNTYYNQYKKAMADFQHISSEMERTRFAPELRAYFKAKNTQLAQYATRYKIQQLDFFQREINSVIRDEKSSLKGKRAAGQTVSAAS